MKKGIICFGLALILAASVSANADQTKSVSSSFATLSKATPVELPAKAAELVAKADVKQCRQTTIDVVKSAVALNPAAAPAIVGSIAQASPEMASVAAATAVSLVPDQAEQIARVAAAAAPAQAGQIVEAICGVVPKQFKTVAEAVAEVAPDQARQILTGVSTAIPAIQVPLDNILASYTVNKTPTVGAVLDQLPSTVDLTAAPSLSPTASASPSLAGPTVGGPYVPPVTPIANINPGSGGQVPMGGRNYAAP